MSLPKSLVLIASLVTAFYLGYPLLTLAQQRFDAAPACVAFDAETDPPPAGAAAVREHVLGKLRPLGYEVFGDTVAHNLMPGSDAFVTIVTHPETRDTAAVITFHIAVRDGIAHVALVEFETRFEDGTALSTVTLFDSVPFVDLPGHDVFYFPDCRDVSEQHTLHRAAVTHEAAGKQPVLPDAKDAADWIARDLADEYAGWAANGGYKRIGETDEYRLTVAGAYLLTWRQLPPGRQIAEAWAEWRAKRWRAEWGLGRE